MHWDILEQKMCAGNFPTRNVEENMTDIRAAMASLENGRRSVIALCDRYGLERVIQLFAKTEGLCAAKPEKIDPS